MPELPEVETIRLSLTPLVGKRIQSVVLSRLAPVETTTPSQIQQSLTATLITGLRRWGKYLLVDTDRPVSLVIHLGMTGQLLLNPPSPPFYKVGNSIGGPPLEKGQAGASHQRAANSKSLQSTIDRRGFLKHQHLTLFFSDSSHLALIDPRRFGTISLTRQPNGTDNRFLSRLGPDYLDINLNAAIFIARCRRHPNLSLKSLLLHQGVAAGLGNIYACEALYRAGLNPRKRVKRTHNEELARLLGAARESLALGVQYGGTTLRDYLDGLGNQGKMKDFLQVYARNGLTLDGRGQVVKIIQNQRSTWYCPALQK